MATYRSIATTETDPQAPITSALMKALDANVTAAFEGDATAVAAGVTLKDPALDTGAATAAGIAWVGLRTAGLAVGAVGSYALLSDQTTTGVQQDRTPGSTLAGSSLNYAAASGLNLTALSGTWRCMGRSQYGPTGAVPAASSARVTVWLRIS